MATKREHAYVWVTWLAKLMAGEKDCEFSTWFRSHHTYDKLPSDFDVAAWTIEHARCVRELRIERLHAKEAVYVGNSNSFAYQPRPGVTLAGRADVVGDSLLRSPTVYTVKTGRPKVSDCIEALIYMYVLPLAMARYGGTEFDGCVVYSDHRIRIPATSVGSLGNGIDRRPPRDLWPYLRQHRVGWDVMFDLARELKGFEVPILICQLDDLCKPLFAGPAIPAVSLKKPCRRQFNRKQRNDDRYRDLRPSQHTRDWNRGGFVEYLSL